VAGKKIAIQGLGSVGMELARMLFWEGAELIVSDLDPERCRLAKTLYNAEVASDIYSMPCDVFSPCAMGGILNAETIARLRCKAVAGSANNQLKEEQDAERLLDRGILYAPDFVINAGGLINVSQELSVLGYQPAVARKRVHALYDQLMTIFALADQKRCSTQEAVVALVDERLANGIGRRTEAPCFHHAGT
jgi:leucine dehydrogenase